MKLNSHGPLQRFIERAVLWLIFGVCIFITAKPLREKLFAWNSQRVLEARWQQARSQAHSHPQSRNASRSSTRNRLSALSTRHSAHKRSDEPAIWPLTRLSCPKMKLDAFVVEGTGTTQLREGPGHEADTSWPGGKNCVIAAHRNAFGWWFYRLNAMKSGDSIVLQVPERKFVYRVVTSRIVSVHDTSILRHQSTTPHALTLYTCTLPKTELRLVVLATLIRSQPI